ncbi:MAG TPA: hypothetical protein VIJ15_00885 [Dermatophilaceae bacterium]
MVTNARSAVAGAAIWLAAVAGVSAASWFAIDRAGRDIANVSISTLPPVPLNTPTLAGEPTETTADPEPATTPVPSPSPGPSAAPKPTAGASAAPKPTAYRAHPAPTPTPTGSRHPAPVPSSPPEAPTPKNQSTRAAGGVVSVRCTGATIALLSAQPENDWRVHVDTSSSRQIAVSFRTGEEEEQRSTEVSAVCTDGTPVFTVNNG